MTKGPLGYGRYDDDSEHVGCPRTKTDMTPCVARDGRLAATNVPPLSEDICVGCSENPSDLLKDLVYEVTRRHADRIPQACMMLPRSYLCLGCYRRYRWRWHLFCLSPPWETR